MRPHDTVARQSYADSARREAEQMQVIRMTSELATDTHIAFCTCPDTQTARTIANILIEQGLAACINLLPGIESIYRWEDELKSDTEVLLLIKYAAANAERLQGVIVANHPYELPEIIAVSIEAGLPAYLDWIRDSSA